jgi:four helix bundle protein
VRGEREKRASLASCCDNWVPEIARVVCIVFEMRDHRSLEAWKEARQVTGAAFAACRSHWKAYAGAAFDQFQRSALSTQLNIAEGYAIATPRRLVNHFTIAYGSAIESAELLQLGLDEQFFPAELATDALKRAKRCQALLLGLIKRYRQ